tara:strand:+ start:1114 stop:1464 length:351 start_codon:yes stop_codon:yes gene_type:complete
MRESKLYPDRQKKAYVDIDETICFYKDKRIYELAEPNITNINKINKLKKEGWHITYYTARGGASKIDYTKLTTKQLNEWGCLFDDLIVGYKDNPQTPIKPSYDLIIDDKAKRIEEL